jgi:cyclopropane-fatty-acyl-phospholipid synthase
VHQNISTLIQPKIFAQKLILKQLTRLQNGRLSIYFGNEVMQFGNPAAPKEISAKVTVTNIEFWHALAFRGSVGAGEAYAQGWWTTDDLTAVVRILALNKEVVDGMDSQLVSLIRPIWKAWHWMKRNNRDGSVKNISAHYDLGNEFFKQFLDETMMYSAAFFEHPDMTLAEASCAKNDRLCQKLDLQPTDHLVEIGSGWGGFAVYAAKKYGCKITTTTISKEQFKLATERIANAGLQDRVTVLLKDYRDLTGTYDKLVSIEMIEAVGNAFYEDYFAACSRLLKPDGIAAIQAITISDKQFQSALGNVDFIQKYIFPGSCIPSVTRLLNAATAASDLKINDLEDITAHYAKTLKLWRVNFTQNRMKIKKLGLSDEFLRMWEFYFCYCEGGFIERAIGDVQMIFTKPMYRKNTLNLRHDSTRQERLP